MASRITLSDDHTKFIYTKDESLLEEQQEEDDNSESPSSVNDLEEDVDSQVAENESETEELDDDVPQVAESEPKSQDLEDKTEDDLLGLPKLIPTPPSKSSDLPEEQQKGPSLEEFPPLQAMKPEPDVPSLQFPYIGPPIMQFPP